MDPRTLVCSNCWEQLFKHNQFWAQPGLSRSQRCDMALRITGGELLSAAQAPTNCNFCQLVMGSIQFHFPKAFTGGARSFYSPMPSLTVGSSTPLVIRFEGAEDNGFEVFILVVSDQQATYTLDSFVLNRREGNNRTSESSSYDTGAVRDMNLDIEREESFGLAKHWLEECTAQHADCPSYEAKPLPTRVVDVGTTGRPPRLVVTRGHVAPYAALSYCWGQPQQWTTTCANISDLITGPGIDLSAVATTIKDGIIATRRLGLQYLWVDALCIIQDDEEDKRAEISRMRDIYKDAYCTLVIESAADSMDGFLRKRSDPDFPAYYIPFAKPQDGGYSYETIYFRTAAAYDYEPQKAAVNSRAWTMEERLLSRRKLLYTQKQLRWECASQKYQDGGLPPRGTTGRDPPSLQPFYKVLDEKELETPWSPAYPEPPLKGRAKLNQFWCLLVNEYTARECTNPKDKIRAFGGIAAEFQRVFPEDRYLAGMWKDAQSMDLLWCRSGDVAARPRPVGYRAPSWSWAAIDSEVLPGGPGVANEETAQYFELLDAETTLRSAKAPFGEVTAGKLTVRGYTRQGKLAYDESSRYNKYTVNGGSACWNASLDALEDGKEVTVWCLWVTESAEQGIHGMLLVPAKEGEKGSFRRIGVFTSQEPPDPYRARQTPDYDGRDWFRQSGERRVIVIV